MTDPIADMLTRIRNAVTAKHTRVDMPLSPFVILRPSSFVPGPLPDRSQGQRRSKDYGLRPVYCLNGMPMNCSSFRAS